MEQGFARKKRIVRNTAIVAVKTVAGNVCFRLPCRCYEGKRRLENSGLYCCFVYGMFAFIGGCAMHYYTLNGAKSRTADSGGQHGIEWFAKKKRDQGHLYPSP